MGNKIGDSKAFYLVISIIISVTLWFYIVTVENPNGDKTIRSIPITLYGEDVLEDRGLMITGVSPGSFNLNLVGRRNALVRVTAENVTVTLDVSSVMSEGILVLKCKVTLPSTITSGTVSVSGRNDYSVTVTVSKQISKPVEVRGILDGQIAEGYQAEEFIITPSTVTITGQEDHVRRVAYVLLTVTADNLSESLTGVMGFVPMGFDGQELSGLNVRYSEDTVFATLPIVKVLMLPLSVDIVEGGGATVSNASVTIEPASIVVSGSESLLSTINEIELGQIHLAEILSTQSFVLPIVLPAEVSNESGISEAIVTVAINGLSSKMYEADRIEVINVPSGFDAKAVTQSLQVWVRGPSEALAHISARQIRAVADLSGSSISAGQFRVPVKVYLDDESDAGIAGKDYTVVIQVTS